MIFDSKLSDKLGTLGFLVAIVIIYCGYFAQVLQANDKAPETGDSKSAAAPAPQDAKKLSSEQIENFEKHIRPILAEHCIECHGPKKQEYGLRLDQRQAFIKGGDDGVVFDPKEPAKSKIINVLQHTAEIKMPPKTKLPDEKIAAITSWVQSGAPWPIDEHKNSETSIPDESRAHWAFQPVVRPATPAVKDQTWIKQPLDAFILSKLEQREISPSPAADPRTLLRRVTYDLTGLPPTLLDIDDFVRDPSQEAYEKVIDRLLASPRYGERWGRYWLDLARYADTRGYLFQEDRNYAYAYVYRDWVIKSFNDDMPYDEFLMKQIAADQMQGTPNTDKSDLAALGFISLGRRFLNNKFDIIDDRIDTVMRTTQALTVSCARCHDHKFDNIPTSDYYSLFGVFDASEDKVVAIVDPTQKYTTELSRREIERDTFITLNRELRHKEISTTVGNYLLDAQYGKNSGGDSELAKLVEKLPTSPHITDRWERRLKSDDEKKSSPIFSPWFQFVAIPKDKFFEESPKLTERIVANDDKNNPINKLVAAAFVGEAPKSMLDVAAIYTKVFQQVENDWTSQLLNAAENELPAPEQLENTEAEKLRRILYGDKAPCDTYKNDDFVRLFKGPEKNQHRELIKAVVDYKASTEAPTQVHTITDVPNIPAKSAVLVRGNPSRRGPEVQRHYLTLVSTTKQKPFDHGSGRLDLAREIVSPLNPLTARVMVNRVWMHHFGEGLVRTSSDFGLRSDTPEHIQLLDLLATDFMNDGWSLKKLHRKILLSNTYRQSSLDRADISAKDPENTLFWRMNRQRLDFESLRDSLLTVAGQLDPEMGGRSQDVMDGNNKRRTVYAFIERQNLPGLFRTFDFASPDAHTSQRFTTTVPQQALFMLNNEFVVQRSMAVITRAEIKAAETMNARIQAFYRCILGRDANQDELKFANEFLNGARVKPEKPEETHIWVHFAQALLMTNEFTFID